MPVAVKRILEWTGGELVVGSDAGELVGISTDTRALDAGELFVALVGASVDGHRFCGQALDKGAGGLVVGAGWEPPAGATVPVIRVPDTTRALGDIARGIRMRRVDLQVAGITGSAGKTTTKDLTAAIARAAYGEDVLVTEGNYNNHIGVPATLFRLGPHHTHAVIEMGMNHPGEIRYLAGIARPQTVLITNVHPVHLEFFESVDEIARAKAEILEGLGPGDTAILNADDVRVAALAAGKAFSTFTFGVQKPARLQGIAVEALGVEGLRIECELNGERFSVRTRLLGAHNAYNVLGALSVGAVWGIEPAAMAKAIEDLAPASKRMRILRLPSGARAIDDVYNANPRSMELALAFLTDLAKGQRAFAALGDMFELGDYARAGHRRVGLAAAAANLSGLVLLGAHAETVREAAIEGGLPEENCFIAKDHDEAARLLAATLRRGDWVLVKGSRGMQMERVLDGLKGDA